MTARFIRLCSVIGLAALMGAATPAAAQHTLEQQPTSPVYSGVSNMFSKETKERPQTREEYRAAREARKAAENQSGPPLPKDVFYDQDTQQWKRIASGRSGGKYVTATTCYDITLQTETTRVMRPVACKLPVKK